MTPKPCPFCGNNPDNEPIHVSIPCYGRAMSRHAIWCGTCEFYGPQGRSEELSIEAWNTRAGSEYKAEIEKLKAELKQLKGGK